MLFPVRDDRDDPLEVAPEAFRREILAEVDLRAHVVDRLTPCVEGFVRASVVGEIGAEADHALLARRFKAWRGRDVSHEGERRAVALLLDDDAQAVWKGEGRRRERAVLDTRRAELRANRGRLDDRTVGNARREIVADCRV